jgi:hypothetical protein
VWDRERGFCVNSEETGGPCWATHLCGVARGCRDRQYIAGLASTNLPCQRTIEEKQTHFLTHAPRRTNCVAASVTFSMPPMLPSHRSQQ